VVLACAEFLVEFPKEFLRPLVVVVSVGKEVSDETFRRRNTGHAVVKQAN
jgi:hypothetical protein